MMSKVLILVEGQTEEKFVKTVLEPYLARINIYPVPIIIITKYVKSGPDFKGGITAYRKVQGHLNSLLNDSSATAITTMFDYYGLPNDFPGRRSAHGTDCYQKVRNVEKAFSEDVNHERFIPYLQLHEFEGLLFSSPTEIAKRFENEETTKYGNLLKKLQSIRDNFKTPEEINDDIDTCPHKRIEKLIPRYGKVLFGSIIASNIGLDIIRKECPHFNEWLAKIESLRP